VGNVRVGETGAGVTDGTGADESRIEAPYLQLVLTRLWEEESTAGSRILRLETLTRLGGAERIVPQHLDATMAKLSRTDTDIAARIFHFLVTPSGTKIAHRVSDLAEYAELPVSKVRPLLDHLSGQQARILRGTDDGKYEIYHDVLAAAILDWRSRRLEAIKTEQKLTRTLGPALGVLLALLILLIIVLVVIASAH
jgi:hypothetical protein